MSIRVYTDSFMRQSARLKDVRQWSSPERFWARQAKGLMMDIVGRVPPSAGKADLAAKKRGEGAVARDVAKLFQPVPRRQVEHHDLAGLHRSHRNDKGIVPTRSKRGNRYKVSHEALRSHLRESKGKVGFLAAGFNAASERTGYRPPAWILRHRAPGGVALRVSERGIYFRATNSVRYASNVSRLEAQIQRGLNQRAAKIWLEVEFLLKLEAAKAGFQVR